MDMDTYKVSEMIKNNHRFINPFEEPCSYYIVKNDGYIDAKIIKLYWKQLKYAIENVDLLIQQGFQSSFYEFYGLNQRIVKSTSDLCQRLIFESFVLILEDNTATIGCCLSNPEFMFGHYIEYNWDCDWNLIDSFIC